MNGSSNSAHPGPTTPFTRVVKADVCQLHMRTASWSTLTPATPTSVTSFWTFCRLAHNCRQFRCMMTTVSVIMKTPYLFWIDHTAIASSADKVHGLQIRHQTQGGIGMSRSPDVHHPAADVPSSHVGDSVVHGGWVGEPRQSVCEKNHTFQSSPRQQLNGQ